MTNLYHGIENIVVSKWNQCDIRAAHVEKVRCDGCENAFRHSDWLEFL